jgi:hypothetical protein
MHRSDWHSTQESEIAVTAIAITVADMEKMTDEEMDGIRNTAAPTAYQTVIQRMNVERESVLRAETATPEVQTTNLESKEMMNEHVINADSLVTSKVIAFTTNEFKNSILKLRQPAGDRHLP